MQQGGRYKDNASRMEATFLKRSHQKLNHIGPRAVNDVQSDFPCFDISEVKMMDSDLKNFGYRRPQSFSGSHKNMIFDSN